MKKIKKLYKDNNVRWTFDTAQNPDRSESRYENRSENRAESPTPESGGRGPQADRIDDDDSTGDYYANTAFHIAQITTPKDAKEANHSPRYKLLSIAARSSQEKSP